MKRTNLQKILHKIDQNEIAQSHHIKPRTPRLITISKNYTTGDLSHSISQRHFDLTETNR